MKKIIPVFDIGETRVKKEFLWLPKTLPINGSDAKVKRWFEFAKISQEYEKVEIYTGYGGNGVESIHIFESIWVDKYWEDINIIIEQ